MQGSDEINLRGTSLGHCHGRSLVGRTCSIIIMNHVSYNIYIVGYPSSLVYSHSLPPHLRIDRYFHIHLVINIEVQFAYFHYIHNPLIRIVWMPRRPTMDWMYLIMMEWMMYTDMQDDHIMGKPTLLYG